MPASAEEVFWDGKLAEGRHGQLETVSKAATTWSELFAALLGIFGTVTFAGGLTALEDLDGDYQTPVKVATLLAAALMLGATVLAARAAGTFTKKTSDNTWQGLQTTTNSRAETARGQLQLAQMLGVAAAAIFLVGSAFVLWVGEADAPAKKPPTVIAVVNGTAVCGKVTGTTAGVLVGSTVLSGEVQSLVVVDACP